MTAIRTLIATTLLSALPIGGVFAQSEPASTGSDALSAEKVPNTTAVGQTKPPSRDASPTVVTPIERPTPAQASDDAVAAKVCVGCGTEAAKADPLSLRIRPSVEPERRDAGQPGPAPKQQSDLDTVALASAHRERAESVQEKTTGLWQSWLVSVCEGCGDQKPAKALKTEDWPDRDGPAATGSLARKPPALAARQEAKPVDTKSTGAKPADAKAAAMRPRGSLEADLSPDNVDSIRRMPQR